MLTLLLLASMLELPAPVRSDFDRDGRVDIASVRERPDGAYELIVTRGAAGAPVAVIKRLDRRFIANFYIARADAGRVQTWCGKGGDDGKPDCPRRAMALKGGELLFGMEEASESVALWTGSRFEVVLLSD